MVVNLLSRVSWTAKPDVIVGCCSAWTVQSAPGVMRPVMVPLRALHVVKCGTRILRPLY